MKKAIILPFALLIAFLCLNFLAEAQSKSRKAFTKLKNDKSASYQLRAAGQRLYQTITAYSDSTWPDEDWTDLKDPWEEDSVKQDFMAFEAAALNDSRNRLLPPARITAARQKYPGNEAEAIRQRWAIYQKLLIP